LTKLCIVLLLGAMSCSIGCATWAGKPPPCPPPDPYVIEDLKYMVKANLQDGRRFAFILEWVGEVERYCAGIAEMRQ